MTGAVRDFVPVRDGHVSIYLCGATVQGLPHIGHVRSGVAFDVLRRWLMAKGFDVAFIRNVTDIDDKILNKAADAGRPWWEWAATYERAFSAAYDALGVLPPSAEPRATGHITQIVELIERLIDNEHAYAGGRRRLLRRARACPITASCPGTRSTTCIRARASRPASATSVTSPCGRARSRASRPGRRRGAGAGRAGTPSASRWRSAYLGPEFDIHCGGMDLVFPHHENEIAQAEAAGDGFARYWLHNGWVTMGGEKMSKSLGNVLAIPAVLQRVRPAELRYYLGSAHYRSMLEFSETALQDAAKAYTGIEDFLHRVRNRVGAVEPGEWTPQFAAALDDDLAVPIALAEVHAARAEGNRALDAGDHETAMAARRVDPGDDGHPRLRPARRALGVPRRDVGGAGRGRRAGARGAASSRAGGPRTADWAKADEIRDRLKEPASRSPTPPTGHSGRCWTETRQVDGGQLPTPWRGTQGGHQEGPDGRFGRCAPARAGGPRAPRRRRTMRAHHPGRQSAPRAAGRAGRPAQETDETEIVLGRNPVLECLRAGVPATALYVVLGPKPTSG